MGTAENWLERAPSAAEIPLLVSIPHCGTHLPQDVADRMQPHAADLPDTDWHLHRLYDFVPGLGAWTVYAHLSRYAVDLNRAPDGAALYPGRTETSLVPVRTFAGASLYLPGAEPDANEVQQRRARWWDPYHAALGRRLQHIKDRHGYALLFDAHSITGWVPSFSPEPLPDFMPGDVDGTSCAPALSAAVHSVIEGADRSWQANRPFKGGYITRSLGRPSERIHALQLEMSQRTYMTEGAPYAWNPELADGLRPLLGAVLDAYVKAGQGL